MRKLKINKKKKASVMDIFIWMIVAFIVVVFFGLWVYGFNLVSNTIQNVTIKNNSYFNLTEASQNTFGQVNTANKTWIPIIAFAIISSMIFTIFLSNFLIKTHPVFFVVYLFITIGAIIVSAYISNQYEILTQNSVFGSTLLDMKAGTFILLNLPLWTTIIGIFGAVFLLSGILRDAGTGGGI